MVVNNSTDTTLVKKSTSVQLDFEKQFKRGLQLYAITSSQVLIV